MTMTLSDLHKHVRQRATSLSLTADVVSGGTVHSHIAIVSAYPGPTELRTLVPFSGGAGNLLWECLRRYGWNRNNVYTTNVIKKVTTERKDGETVSRIEFDLWTQILKWELSQLPNLEYILILGSEALHALTDLHNALIIKWRGSIVDADIGSRKVKALVSINPALVTRCINILRGEETGKPPMASAKRIFQFDIHKFRLLTEGKLSNYVITEHINPTYAQAMDFINHCANFNGPVAFDIETTNRETSCVGLATDPHEGLCINFIRADLSPAFSLADEASIKRGLHNLLSNAQRGVRADNSRQRVGQGVFTVAQNGGFDTSWLWFKDKIKARVTYDTLLAHHTLYSGLPHNLGFLTSRYTTHPYYKDEKDNWRTVGDADRFWRYNVKDCCITLAVQEATYAELVKNKLDDFFFNHVMRLQPHLALMTVGGIKCDTTYKAALADIYERDLSRLLDDFYRAVADATGDSEFRPNPRSWAQVGELFFRRLKLVGRGTSTDEANRTRMAAHPRTSPEAHRVLDVFNKYTKGHKFFSTYVETEIDDDGRFRCEYKQFGTTKAPGRLSSSETGWNTGSNLQNQPHSAYPMFCCEPGYVLIYCDGEQAEARVVGWLARINKWIEDFERARLNPGTFDCHRSLAADMWKIDYELIPTYDVDPVTGLKTLRYKAKRCRHGLNYRMAPDRLSETTQLAIDEARDAYVRYHRINPEIRKWWDKIEEEVRKTGVLFNLLGRRWTLTEIITEKTLESIVAFKPQSTIGDKVNKVIYQCHEDDKWPNQYARLAMNTHDGLVGIAREDKADTCLHLMKKHYEEPLFVPDMPPLIIPTAIKRTYKGTSWRIKEDGNIDLYDDEKGVHRWSNVENLRLTA